MLSKFLCALEMLPLPRMSPERLEVARPLMLLYTHHLPAPGLLPPTFPHVGLLKHVLALSPQGQTHPTYPNHKDSIFAYQLPIYNFDRPVLLSFFREHINEHKRAG